LGLSRSIVWNCTGGVSTQVTDENGNPTTASFTDPNFWRPTQTTDQENNATTISYHGATSVESSLSFNSGGSVSDVLTTLDGYGRLAFTQKRQGPGATDYDTTEMDYNSTGQPFRTTLPYSAAGSPSSSNTSAPATTKTFDALGRVLTITKGDTGTISYTYTNNDVLQTVSGSQAFKKQLEYDGLGRLTSVCEISSSLPGISSCGQGVSQNGYLTKYSYDGLGHLLTVTQNAQASGSPQTRSFAYDLMGRMTSETDPETGTFHYFWDTYPTGCMFSHNFPGNLAATEDNSGVFLCGNYDQRNRLTGYGNNATNTNCRGLVYDTATNTPPAGLSNTKGRLLEAFTNSTCAGHNDVVTDEFFSYSVRGEITDILPTTPPALWKR
jgi:YD repeat-containing protein